MISHPPGWDDIVTKLHKRLLEIIPEYRVFQTKEKFGTLRYYVDSYGIEDTKVWYKAQELIQETEAESATICQRCGSPGKERSDGYIATLCNPCCEKRERI